MWTLLARFLADTPPATTEDWGNLLIHACDEYDAACRRADFPLLSRIGRFISVACASVGRDYALFPLLALHRTYSPLDSPLPNGISLSDSIQPQRVQAKTLFVLLTSTYISAYQDGGRGEPMVASMPVPAMECPDMSKRHSQLDSVEKYRLCRLFIDWGRGHNTDSLSMLDISYFQVAEFQTDRTNSGIALTQLQLLMANGIVPDCEYGPAIIRALMCDPSYAPALREILASPSCRGVGPSVACTLLHRFSLVADAFTSDTEAGLLVASWFLRDAHEPVRGSNRDEPHMRMIECLLLAVPSALLPAASKT